MHVTHIIDGLINGNMVRVHPFVLHGVGRVVSE